MPSKGRKEVWRVVTANERRQLILEALSDRRCVSAKSLALEFGVTERTIRSDIELLSCSAPIYTVQGNGGGIRVTDGWYLSRRYLHDDQEALLRSLLPGLRPEDRETMQHILFAFAKPRTTV